MQFLPIARDFSLFHRSWIGYGAQPESFSVGTGGTVARTLSLHLSPCFYDIRNAWSHSSTSPCAFVACTGTTLSVCVVRSSSMRKTGHAYTGEMRNVYKFFTGKSEGKRPLD